MVSVKHQNLVLTSGSLVPTSLTAFFVAVAKSMVFATAAEKAVREGLGTRLNFWYTVYWIASDVLMSLISNPVMGYYLLHENG